MLMLLIINTNALFLLLKLIAKSTFNKINYIRIDRNVCVEINNQQIY